MNHKSINGFRDFKTHKPPDKGWYLWRVPHERLTRVTLVFLARYRERSTGFKPALSPEFDHWNGYGILLPKGPVEWTEYDGEPPKPGHELIEVAGVQNNPRPFCNTVPQWRYTRRFIRPGPTNADYLYLECCHWFNGFKSRMVDPIVLAEKRNRAIG